MASFMETFTLAPYINILASCIQTSCNQGGMYEQACMARDYCCNFAIQFWGSFCDTIHVALPHIGIASITVVV